LPLLSNDLLESRLAVPALGRIRGKKDHPDTILAEGRKGNAGLRTRLLEKGMRRLQQEAGAVTRVGLSATGAPMRQVLEHSECLAHDLVRPDALDIHNEADAARVVLESRIV
jgi:hypothetical protein